MLAWSTEQEGTASGCCWQVCSCRLWDVRVGDLPKWGEEQSVPEGDLHRQARRVLRSLEVDAPSWVQKVPAAPAEWSICFLGREAFWPTSCENWRVSTVVSPLP